MIRWLRKRPNSKDHLVVSWSGRTLAYVLARSGSGHSFKVLKFGVERQNADTGVPQDLVRRLKALGLDGFDTSVMLYPEQYQLLRIRMPAVTPDELRAAARYQILKMLDTPVDDVTIDVIRVGDGRSRGIGHPAGHLFVVAAQKVAIGRVLELGEAMRWIVSVVDIQETAQRNLQNALVVAREGPERLDRANAALVMLDPLHAVLTISASGELFYTRRFNLPSGFLAGAWQEGDASDGGDVSHTEDSEIGEISEDEQANGFLLEVQRSLDLWDRTWSDLPLNGIALYAGARTEALSRWLTQQLGQTVRPMDVATEFPGFSGKAISDEAPCLPLLGLLLRTERRAT